MSTLSRPRPFQRQLIVSTLVGGLGNQMFQYAAGRALALRRDAELMLDVGWLRPNSTRTRFVYELDAFPINASLTSVYRNPRREQVWEFLKLAPPARRHTGFSFDPGVLELPGFARLIGYWQSEKYFADASDVIRADFAFEGDLDPANATTASRILDSISVCVHVRRGDYVTDPAANSFHGVLPTDYYSAAAAVVREACPEAQFFVFSNDMDWCRAELDFPGPTTFVHHAHNRGVDDLRLMALCRHFIIANSSFSWWGAWLSGSVDKIVIAPKRWAVAEDVGPDVTPEAWLRL